MQDLINHAKNENLHHFYILEGNRETVLEELNNFLDKELKTRPFIEKSFDRLLIDDAREIAGRSLMKTQTGEKMIFNLSFNSITDEAQNALLKVIEEPTDETYFFVIVPDVNIFLPTFLSRAIVLKNTESRVESSANEIIKEVLNATPGERMNIAEKINKDIHEEKIDRHVAKEIIEGLIKEFRVESREFRNRGSEFGLKKNENLKILMDVRQKLDFSGMPIKMLLERAFLILE